MVVRGKVKNGRLVVDEPTDLPEGAEVFLFDLDDDGLTEEEIRELQEIHGRGKYITHEEMKAKLDARRR